MQLNSYWPRKLYDETKHEHVSYNHKITTALYHCICIMLKVTPWFCIKTNFHKPRSN